MSEILNGKTAIVTGAAKGLGLAIARRFAAEGARVVLADIDGDGAERAASALPGATAMALDVRDEAQVERVVADTVAEHGRLDVMVAGAGIGRVRALVDMSLEEWREVLSIDLDGVFLCTKHAGRAMAAAGRGSIINIASIKAFGGSPVTGHYGAAKAGVVSLSKTAALELRGHGVRVNAICPGWFDTDMVNDRAGELEAAIGIPFADYVAHVQGRLGQPDEVAGLAVWLASDRSSFASGAAYNVDGGATASLV